MDELQRHYLEGLNARIEALEASQKELDKNSLEATESIRRIAHTLHGSGTTYGFPKISEEAEKLENASEEKLPALLEGFIQVLRDIASSNELEKTQVLIVEDNPEDAMFIQAILSSKKHELFTAETAAQANQILAENEISLILLDLVLPDTDGRNFLIRIRENPSTAGIPIIVLSGKTSIQTKTECFALGADGYFVKPVAPDLLSAAVSAKIHHTKEIKRKSRVDTLTGLPNRASFHESFKQYYTLSIRNQEPFSVAILDLDHFNNINDLYGHQTGDEVLRRTSQIISKSLRSSDILALWGGEEFVILFPNTNPGEGKKILEGALRLLGEKKLTTKNGTNIHVTFSAGVVEVEENFSVEDTIAKADLCLYKAKDSGRNRVVVEYETISTSPKTILLAEDDDLTADFIKHRLSQAGFRVLHFSDGADAFKAASPEPPDLAILDVKMPGMDGFELLARFREIPAFVKIPIAMLTSMGSEKDISRGLELGADDYILKPFSPSELLARVHRLLKRK